MKLIEAEKAKDVIHEYFKSLMVKDASGADVYKLAVGIVSYLEHDANLLKAIDELPPVQPERIKGHWIAITSWNNTYKCSVCGRLLVNITDGKNKVAKNYPYCHCGAKMEGGEADE